MKCSTCNGTKKISIERMTLGGLRQVERTCYSCYGYGKQVVRTEYKSLGVVRIEEHKFFVCALASEFTSLKGAQHAIDSVHEDWLRFNEESEPEDRFPTLQEYCDDYLREMDE
jgi:hypothetical protein